MQWWTFLAVVLLILLAWLQAESVAQDKLDDGTRLLQRCTAAIQVHDTGQGNLESQVTAGWCQGFVLGFVGGYNTATVEIAQGRRNLCPSNEWQPLMPLVRILVEWLRAHPTELHRDQHSLMTMALADTFPCPSAGTPRTPGSQPGTQPR